MQEANTEASFDHFAPRVGGRRWIFDFEHPVDEEQVGDGRYGASVSGS